MEIRNKGKNHNWNTLNHAVKLLFDSTHTAAYQYFISLFFPPRVSAHSELNVCKWLPISIDLRGIYDGGWLVTNLHRTVANLTICSLCVAGIKVFKFHYEALCFASFTSLLCFENNCACLASHSPTFLSSSFEFFFMTWKAEKFIFVFCSSDVKCFRLSFLLF